MADSGRTRGGIAFIVLAVALAMITPPAMAQLGPLRLDELPEAARNNQPQDQGRVSVDADIASSVVLVKVDSYLPSVTEPWRWVGPESSTGSGVIIEGNRILTNAHVVEWGRQINIQPHQSHRDYSATVEAIAPGMDLALLKVEDKSFFEGRAALPLSDSLPHVRAPVVVYGYPIGGNDLSITDGMISRIEMSYIAMGTMSPILQIDAGLNPGNSGGPAMADGKIVGIVQGGVASAENIGNLIPSQEVAAFVADVDEDGVYDGKATVFVGEGATIENNALKAMLQSWNEDESQPAPSGLIISNPRHAEPYLDRWDVLTHVGPHKIDDKGFVRVREDLRLGWAYYVPKVAKDGKVPLTVWRKGKTVQVDVPAYNKLPHVLMQLDHNTSPKYFIIGPLCFTAASFTLVDMLPASAQVLLANSDNEAFSRAIDWKSFEEEELVMIASSFSHRLMKGYSDPSFTTVTHVNDTRVRNLRHLVELIRDAEGQFLTLNCTGFPGEDLAFDRKAFINSTEQVLNLNGIRYRASKGLRDVWELE